MSEPFDPELRAGARFMPRVVMSHRLARGLRWLRARFPKPRSSPDVIVEERTVRGVRALVARPRAEAGARPGLLWLHGGGYVIGAPEQDAAQCRALAASLGLVVIAPAYRLAPEHPFPAAQDDAHRVLVEMASEKSLGIDADRIAVLGISAGGGLAASLALRAREEGPRLRGQILVYPMLDDRTSTRRELDDGSHRLWSFGSNVYGWRSYLGVEPGGHDVPSGAVAARAATLRGLPPTWIGVGTLDLFHDECVAFAARLEESGVPCALEVARGAYHGFDRVSPRSAIARRFEASWMSSLRLALELPSP